MTPFHIHTLAAAVALALAAGSAAQAAGDGGNAQKAAASVFRENPSQTDPALELQRLRNEGIALYESGIAMDDALKTFERAFNQSAAAPDAFNVAVVYFKKNEEEKSKEWLAKALERDPGFPNAHYLLGVLARAEGDFAAAKQHWERTRELAPDDGHLHYQLALLARSERNEAGFLQSLVNALALEPDNSAALYQMYRYYQTSGNKELADQTLAKFNDLKKQEKFSRKEKRKDPSDLSQPVLTAAAGASGFPVIEVAPGYETSRLDPGCPAVAADSYVKPGEPPAATPVEALAVACGDGRLVQVLPAQGSAPSVLGQLPPNTRDIRTDWFDATGPRTLALTDAGLFIAQGLIGEPSEYTQVLAGAAAPLVLADLDSDGDLDIAVGGGQVPLTNAGKLQFVQEQALHKASPLPGLLGSAQAAAVADLQRDGLVEIQVLGADGLAIALGSPSGSHQGLKVPAAAANALAQGDLDNDGRMDIVLAMPQGVRVLWRPDPRPDAKSPETQDLPLSGPGPFRLLVTDYNNDGLQDLLALGPDGQASLLRNQGGRRFAEGPLGTWPKPAAGARVLKGDFDHDGREDLAYVTADGGLAVARNATAGAGKSIALFAHGVRAAPSGLLTQIEARRGPHYAYAQSSGRIERIGIGQADYVEVLRLAWTNGFTESKLKIDAAPAPYYFKESERISGSCPSLFVWNGQRFDYLTDTFISGPMGVPLDRGLYFPVRDREMLVIHGDRVHLRDGRLDIRFTEELHESVFVDQARLLVVDHPVGTEVYPHSRLAPAPAPAEPFYTAGNLVAPAQATGSDGSDLTAVLAEVDRVDARFYSRSPNSGFAEPHWIELALPEDLDPGAVDALLATGWFFYFESTSMIAQAQGSGPNLPWPWLEQYIDGVWVDVAPVGIPTGKGKTAVVPLQGLLKSRRLRIRSGISLYWDRIAFAPAQGVAEARTAPAPLAEATLRFHGFSALTARDPELFDYHAIRYSALWSPMAGRFTDYGPVEALVEAADGRYALFGSGDEIAFSFQADPPPPGPGQTRSYLLELVGYVKDGDRYTAHPGHVDPMPYLGLDQYPPPADERLRAAQGRSPHRNRAPLDFTLTTIGRDTAGHAEATQQ